MIQFNFSFYVVAISVIQVKYVIKEERKCESIDICGLTIELMLKNDNVSRRLQEASHFLRTILCFGKRKSFTAPDLLFLLLIGHP